MGSAPRLTVHAAAWKPAHMTDTETIHRAYVYVLDPTPAQTQRLESHCGGARFAYNHVLSLVKAVLDQRDAEETYGIPEDQRTPSMGWSHYSLRKVWNARKAHVAPWWSENSKEAYSNALSGLAAGLSNWNNSRKGKRKGKPVGFPTFHGKRARKSFTVTTGVIRVEPSRHHVTLPVVGTLHTLESTRRLHRRLEQGTARVLRATVSRHRGRWQVSLLAEITAAVRAPREGSVVGVDVGVKTPLVAATSDGKLVMEVPVPARLDALGRRKRELQRINRQRQAPRKGSAASNRWLKAQRRISKIDYRMAAIREDVLHKATTELARRFDTIVIEDLNVAGMLTRGGAYKKGFNRAASRAMMGASRTMLKYKAVNVVVADRWFPSSKTCSNCDAVKAKLRLDERVYVCEECGHVMDRDVNASVNLARYAGSPLVCGRGGTCKTGAPSGATAVVGEASTVVDGGSRGNAGMQLAVM